MHLAEMEAVRAGMPVVCVNHDNSGGPAFRDIHLENFNVSVGGRDLIVDGSITLSYGRHYGEFELFVKLRFRFILLDTVPGGRDIVEHAIKEPFDLQG